MEPEILVSVSTTLQENPALVTVSFRSQPTTEAVRSTLESLQEVMTEFRHIMGDSTQQHLTVIRHGVAFSGLDVRSKAAFSVLSGTFELLKQQKQCDQMVSGLVRQLKHVLPFAEKALKEAVEDNMDILQKAIGRLYVLTMDVSEFSCDYIKRNRFKRLGKSIISTRDQDKINELAGGFNEVTMNFDRAINVEMLKAVRGMEEKMLLDKLQPVQSGYMLDRGCMEGTRVSLLNEIIE
ncbi:hypothetical protein FRC16_001151 [Serendipita sp. 398]|nr:hypothetical protein FRC16_001151 [Serendipita sp. 398]